MSVEAPGASGGEALNFMGAVGAGTAAFSAATSALEVSKPTPSMAPLPPGHTLTVSDPRRLDSRFAFGDLLDVPMQLHIIARPIRRRHVRKTITPLTEEELEDLQVGLRLWVLG